MRIRLLLALLSLFYLISLLYSGRSRASLDGSDSWGYYVHLPAFLLYHDTGDYSKTIAAWQSNYSNKPDPRKDAYGIRPTPSGKFAVKYPLGLAILESPFFLGAHVFCLLSGGKADGFSAPYAWAVSLSSLFYAVLGLFFLYKCLRYYFEEKTSLLTCATIGLGTNLFFFVAYTPGMSHPVAFCLVAYWLLATRRWHENPNIRNGLALGVTLGLIALVRTQDLVVALVPFFWGVHRSSDLKKRIELFWAQKVSIGYAFLAFVWTLTPQVVYWKQVSGQWWRYGYQGEKFDWAHPHVLDGLFSFQNGWLIYTPVMFLALFGLFRLRKNAAEWYAPILILLPLHWFVSYSWWCWMYINGFGSRPMVDIYALLAFPLAAWISGQKRRWILLPLLMVFILLNLFQTWQTSQGIFWSERGNWAFYREIFGETKGSDQALAAFESGEVQSLEPLSWVKTIKTHSISISDTANMVQIAGRNAFNCKGEFSRTLEIANDSVQLFPGDWLRISVAGFVPEGQTGRSVDHLAKLVVDFTGSEGQLLKYRAINIGTHIGNPKHILWKTRGTGEWGEASFFVMVPMGFDAQSRLKSYIWNPNGQEIFVGDVVVGLWR